jgi:3-oxoacyl-[acyl-carrier protein] reductase
MKTRTIIVTGGSKGLGQTLVRAFLSIPVYRVATCSRRRTPFIDQLASSQSDRFFFAPIDTSDTRQVSAFVANTRKRFGSVDVLVNNAATVYDGILALQTDAAVNTMLAVNLAGSIAMAKACIREMIKHRWGRIVNITSIVGKTGFRGLSVYSVTKAGLDGLTRSLARELGDRGITVNSVAPGFLTTEMSQDLSESQRRQIIRRTPAGRLGSTEDVVPLVLFLCTEEAGFISGQTIVVDGGMTA